MLCLCTLSLLTWCQNAAFTASIASTRNYIGDSAISHRKTSLAIIISRHFNCTCACIAAKFQNVGSSNERLELIDLL